MKLGDKHSSEAKEKMRLKKLGNKASVETRNRMRVARLGKHISNDVKKKISQSHIGKRHTQESIEKIKMARAKQVTSPKMLEVLRSHRRYKDGRMKNPAYVSWLKNQWHHRRRNADGKHSWEEWETLKAQYNWTCPCCGKREPEVKLSVDHIIPLSKGGSNNIENIQPLCRLCNSKKNNKTIKYEKDNTNKKE